ncbi:ABC transporter permease [Natrarchaeobius oligotrophus]|uniref:ABC transporter permease n=1 Tax=Natrarchaeobius chitinivorans TaxID=1679083 RepID=A0A3N6M5X4_NATCH|nr:ABC transporter permease [Natrarchaeobius chitinivorans]RQG98978.1 ABC transporter permease [Natrarchaeobius chitinivorans]
MIPFVGGYIQGYLDKNARYRRIYARFKRNKLAMVGLYFSLIYLVVAILAPLLMPHDPGSTDGARRLMAPTLEHPFGTDRYGRDVFSRVLYGTRISLQVAAAVVTIATVTGVVTGLVAGYYRSWVDEAISRTVDVFFAFPNILLGLIVVAILGPGLNQIILALGIAFAPIMTRITRGSAISVREEEYVLAAKSYGEHSFNIMFREMLPNMVSAVMVQATIIFAFSILAEAGLSYLGLSAQPPTPTWGVMISEGQRNLQTAPWISIFPGLAIMSTVLGLTFLGVGLRDALDPKTDVDTDTTGGL